MKTKADKLIARGSETPEVAQAAEHISDMLIRMYLNQPHYFADAVRRAVPHFNKEDAEKMCDFFTTVADHFRADAREAHPYPQPGHRTEIRKWGEPEVGMGCYDILRVFAVLACDLDYCADNPDCWETRRAFCKMDGRQS